MRAVQLSPVWDATVVEVPDPRIERPGDAIVGVSLASICGSDLRVPPIAQSRPGHEFVGTIVEVGPDVRKFRVGDRVVGACVAGCGDCPACRRGDPLSCAAWRVFGEEEDLPGGQAELVRVPGADLHLVAQGSLPEEVAILLSDTLPSAWLAVRAASISAGGDVLVIGLGPVGLCSVLCALEQGAGAVFAVDPNPVRAALARSFGATLLDPAAPVAEQVRSVTGKRAGSVIEAVGNKDTVAAALDSAGTRGTVVVIGQVVLPEIAVPFHRIGARSLTVRGLVCAPSPVWPEAVPLATRLQDDLASIVNRRGSLDEAPDIYRALRGPAPSIVKAVLRP